MRRFLAKLRAISTARSASSCPCFCKTPNTRWDGNKSIYCFPNCFFFSQLLRLPRQEKQKNNDESWPEKTHSSFLYVYICRPFVCIHCVLYLYESGKTNPPGLVRATRQVFLWQMQYLATETRVVSTSYFLSWMWCFEMLFTMN